MDSDNLERTLDENLALLSSLCPPEPGTAVQPPVLRPPRRTAQLAAKLRRQLEENRPWLTAVESNLLSAARGRPVKTLYVTSCRPGEGKSMAAVLLAHTLAGSGGTVLVDANLTHPTLHSAFVARHAPGLVDYVAGDVELEDVAQHTDIARLALLPCGGDPATQPSGSLSPQALGQRLKELRNRFDWVVFDGESVLNASGAALLARLFDGVLLVVECERTKREVVALARDKLVNVGGNVLGVVLNRRQHYIPGGLYARV